MPNASKFWRLGLIVWHQIDKADYFIEKHIFLIFLPTIQSFQMVQTLVSLSKLCLSQTNNYKCFLFSLEFVFSVRMFEDHGMVFDDEAQ